MNKNTLMLLEDFIKDGSDIRLSILCKNLNPYFKLDKKNKEQVKLLINDYVGDRNKGRLKVIESLILNQSPLFGKRNNKNDTQIQSKTSTLPNKLTSLLQTPSKEMMECNILREEVVSLRAMAGTNPSMMVQLNLPQKEAKLKMMETALGLRNEKAGFDREATEDNERTLLISTLGYWEDKNSLSHEILYGHQNLLTIVSFYNVEMMIGTKNFNSFNPPDAEPQYHVNYDGFLEKYSNVKITRRFNLTNAGVDMKNGSIYKLSDASTGFIAPSITMNVEGKEVSVGNLFNPNYEMR